MKIKSLIKHNLMRAAMTLALILACAAAWAQTTQSVTYIDADGNTQTVTATVLTGSESDLYAGWYVVNSDITYTSRVSLFGDMNLILVDGKTMSIGTADSPISGANAIDGSTYYITIYGQSGQTGKLCAYNNSSSYDAVVLEHFNQHGGIVIINSNTDALSVYGNLQLTQGSLNVISSGASKNAIYISNTLSISGGTLIANAGYGIVGAVNFTGGNLTAIGTYRGISGNTNLSWTSTTNTFKCSRYGGNVTIAEGKTFYDGATPYSGTLNSSQKDAIAGKTLRPYSSNDFSVNDEGTEYTIYSAIGWDMFCDMLDEFDHSTNGGYCFDGKTVKLGANISITRAAGNTGYHDFTGIFDGQGHTLTVNITDTGEQGTAPFRVISNGATIRNLHVTGSVTGTAHAAGLVGKACAGTMLIENCLVEANVNSTVGDTNGNKHCGGIVGHGFGNNLNPNNVSLTLRNCVYTGTITCDQNYIGGLQGWSDGNTLTLENCLFAGNYQGTATGTALFHPIALHNTGKSTNLTATNVFTAVAPTVTNANFIAANGTKTTGRTTAPDNLGTQGATYSFMNMTVYQNGLYYNGLYYVAPTLSTDNDNAYLINNEDDWTNFCDMLYNNDTWNRFSGQTVKLTASIGTAESPVTRMAGYATHDFCGTFDGQGNTITVSLSSSGENTALFSYISNTKANPNDANDSPAAILNLKVAGTVTVNENASHKYAGGLVGSCWGVLDIENCCVSTVIESHINGDGTHGGIVGRQANGTLTITGCVFDGQMLGSTTNACGGIVGYRHSGATDIYHTLFAPTALTMSETNSATFICNATQSCHEGCYYTVPFGATTTNENAQGTKVYSISKGEYVTTLEINGTATPSYDVSGLSFYSTGIKCGDVLYAAANDVVSLILGCTPPLGYHFIGYTATAGTLNGTTLTMPYENVTINVTLEELPEVSYIDENGDTLQCTAYTLLDGTESTLEGGWYVVNSNITFTDKITCTGDAHFILCDGYTMNVGTTESPTSGFGIYGSNHYSISIYAQSTGESKGQLHVSTSAHGIYASYGNVNICGGEVMVSAGTAFGIYSYNGNITIANGQVTSEGEFSIYASGGNITINGGQVSSAGYYGIYASNGDITISGGEVSATSTGTDMYSYGIYASNGNITINSGEVTANGPCGIFVRGGNIAINGGEVEATGSENGGEGIIVLKSGSNGGNISISNATVTATGSIGIHAQSGITINSGTVTANNGNYGIYASSCNLTINGGQVTAEGGTYGIYASNSNITISGGQVTANGSCGIYVVVGDITISGGEVEATGNNTNGEGILAIKSSDNGGSISISNATVTATGSIGIHAESGITINSGTVTANNGNFGIYADGSNLTISGGQVTANGNACGIFGDNITITSGEVTANGTDGIYANNGNLIISGGQVTANGNSCGIFGDNITLGWTNASDYIYANSYYATGTLSIAEGKAFKDMGGNTYSGIVPRENEAYAINGKTLHPYIEGSVPYIDENGQWQLCTDYTTISDNTVTTFGQNDNVDRWYVVTGTVNFTSPISFMSNSNIIIAEGAVLNVGTAENPVSGYLGGIFSHFDLKIYAESGTTGHVSVYSASNRNAIFGDAGELVIVNCEVNASGSVGIYDTQTGINIVGCQLNLAGGNGVKSTTGPVTLKNTTLIAPSLTENVIYSPVDLTLDSCTVVAVTSDVDAIESYGGTNGIIIKNNSNINVETTTDGNSNGIFSQMGVSIEGSTVEAKGNRGINASGALTITDATVKATGGGHAIFAGSSITLDGSNMTAKSTSSSAICAYNGNITIRNNGKTIAESTNNYGCFAISAESGNVIIESGTVEATGIMGIYGKNVNISGGQVSATGPWYGVLAWSGNITLGWTNASDYIHANSYLADGGTLSIAEGKTFKDVDGNNYESGPVNASEINGKWLYPSVASIYTKGIEAHGTDESPSGWYLIASPLAGETNAEAVAHLINTTNPENFDLYRFDPSNEGSEWVNYKADNFSLVNGHGYLYASNDTKVLCFAGSFITDTESVAVGLAYDASDDHKCWNLVGNPFPCEATINKPYYMLNADGATINPEAIVGGTIPACTAVFVKGESGDDRVVFSKVSAPASSAPIGAIDGLFSVSADKQVYFSQGNLQYQPSTATWRFAPNQYDLLFTPEDLNLFHSSVGNYADVTSLYTENYTDWIDFFGWGTSGWNSGANAYMPYDPSYMYDDFYPGGDYNNDLTGTCANADWAWYNPISNGGNAANQWRTLTHDEWAYLFSGRDGATSKYGHGSVNGVNGMIILPDNWTLPDGCSFTPGNSDWTNSYTTTEWAAMEAAGAVFLPAAGQRSFGTFVNNVGNLGRYWSSTHRNNTAAYDVWFHSDFISELDTQVYYSNRSMGYSVRPVQDAQ